MTVNINLRPKKNAAPNRTRQSGRVCSEKDCLHDLNNIKLVRADDPDVVRLRKHLTEKIGELEGHANGHQHPYQRAA
jgi:hypothetical protein